MRVEVVMGGELPRRIGEYVLLEELGRGAMGSVHLARDTLLDRDVALKLIASEELDDESIALFFREARALARVAHPNVVAIHRVGRIERQPYLVTELVRGGTLAALSKPVPWQRALSLGIGIARGLAAAHAKKVLHRDVKPANVMLDEGGDAKLVDFGLAKPFEEAEMGRWNGVEGFADVARPQNSSAGEIAGTPLYMAPEVLFGKPATVQSDIYGVGAVLYELVVGVAPRDTLPPDIPLSSWITSSPIAIEDRAAQTADPRFAQVVRRCLAVSSSDRYSSANALAEALEAVLEAEDVGDLLPRNPYRGLETFETEHRGVFFGREPDIRAAARRLRDDAMVVIAGDSGVGKSSLCKAGVLPSLSRAAFEHGKAVRVVSLVPGPKPLRALESALDGLLPPRTTRNLEALIDGDHADLYREIVSRLEADEDLLLFVDQLEELCTLSEPKEARFFAEALCLARAGPRVRVLATLRGDFITQVAAIPSFGDLATSLYLLRPMAEEGIRAAILKPALRHGIAFESEELVDELVRAATETAGGLPLLEFALSELWSARDEAAGLISSRALRSMGSVAGSLARHADAVLKGLGPQEKSAAKKALLMLSHTNHTRVRRTWEELGGGVPASESALHALVNGRLVVARKLDDGRVFEIAHEALLREWETLRRWMAETREQRQAVEELEQAAELWSRRGRYDEETWTGAALAQAVRRREIWSLDLPLVARAFLDAGLARERALHRRRRWFFGGGASLLIVLAVVSTVAAIAFAEKEKQAIQQQAQIRLAAADMGEFDLVLAPFDWDPVNQTSTAAPVATTLDFRFHAIAVDDVHAPGKPYGDGDIRRSARRVEGTTLKERVEARSGPAFLEVFGRGETCASIWVPLQRLPGYTDRVSKAPVVLRVPVPTCAASEVGTIEVPAGEFYAGRPVHEKSTDWQDGLSSLPAFRIDRTEVTRGAFSVYASMEAQTGDIAARTAYLDLDRRGGERLPIVGVNALMAANYCRFMGKDLPSADQWLKAMRGGLVIDGKPNRDPKRNTPWGAGASTAAHPTNLIGEEDGFPNLAPVDSFPADRSPYGIMDLAGNVGEWTRDSVNLSSMRGLRFVFGAGWDTPPEHAHWGNMRPDRYLDFTIGIRCVYAVR